MDKLCCISYCNVVFSGLELRVQSLPHRSGSLDPYPERESSDCVLSNFTCLETAFSGSIGVVLVSDSKELAMSTSVVSLVIIPFQSLQANTFDVNTTDLCVSQPCHTTVKKTCIICVIVVKCYVASDDIIFHNAVSAQV